MPKKPVSRRGKTAEGKLESRIERVTAFLELRMSQMHSYHDHKETMAHATILVALAYVGAIISSTNWPPDWVTTVCVSSDVVAALGALAVWFFIHVYMRWQLRNRRVAALYVACLLTILRQWANSPPSSDDLTPYEGGAPKVPRIHTLVDFIVPWKFAHVPSDEGMLGYPRRVVEEYRNIGTGAMFAENLVTYGSLMLGLLILVRTWP